MQPHVWPITVPFCQLFIEFALFSAPSTLVVVVFALPERRSKAFPSVLAVYCQRRATIFLHVVGNHLPNCPFLVRNITENKPRTFDTMKLEAMFHCVQKCNLIFSPVETYLNPQRSSRRPPSWIFIRNILFILPLGAEWMEWHSVHSGIGMQNRKTRSFYILAILIPEL